MIVFHTKQELNSFISKQKEAAKSIGFVPTMGALHQGHYSLVHRAYEENDIVVVSIFVNPTQFDDPSDLEKYPRTLAEDQELLKDLADKLVIYAPAVLDVYPEEPVVEKIDYGVLTQSLEGEFRPGHFDGMVDVVRKLLLIVKPHIAYFGEKDYQQLAIIRYFVRKEEIPVSIVGCPIVREEDGLAMSSRNRRLSLEHRKEALHLSQTLKSIQKTDKTTDLQQVLKDKIAVLNQLPNTRVEYLRAIDAQTLENCTHWNQAAEIICCIAVYVGAVRLIDNMKVKP
ncbi:MAG: pantoate--beta-alanine ligase [Flavobacteriales bacterium]|jgi:pantoate--beta-alanine ligase|nr:pantoate--beta-alanine ligase [Flavobacteriales bacterium]